MPKRLIVDGYNLIHADPELKAALERDAESARERLVASLVEHCAREGLEVELVFDAAGREGGATSEMRSPALKVTYTARGQSADAYIEKLSYERRGRSGDAVVTGDYDQQKVAGGAGMLRISSREFIEELRRSRREAARESDRGVAAFKVSVRERLPDAVKDSLERLKRREP